MHCDEDLPLHAGLLVDLVLGNLGRIIAESGYRYQSIPHGTDEYAQTDLTPANEWAYVADDWNWWPVMVRRAERNALRKIRVVVYGRVETAGTTITVRFYAIAPRPGLYLHPTEALIGESAYAETTFTSTAYEKKDVTIRLSGTRRSGSESIREDETVPATDYEQICILAVAQTDVDNEYLRLRAPMIEEVLP